MTASPGDAVETAARELLRALADLPQPPTIRVADVDGRVASLLNSSQEATEPRCVKQCPANPTSRGA